MDNDETSKQNILIVDDTVENLRLLDALLTNAGYQVRPTSDARLGLLAAQRKLPDLVLLDIRMPGMDGYEFCEKLKADERTRDIPVIFISALHETPDKVRGFALGGVDYITKPFQDTEVLARVERHLTIRNLQKQLEARNEQLASVNSSLTREIAERQRSERSLAESEERYRHLVEFSPITIAVHSQSKIVFVNAAGARMLSATSPTQIIGKMIVDFVTPEYHAVVAERMREMRETGKPAPLIKEKWLRIDGTAIDVEAAATTFTYRGNPATLVVARDITARVRSERERAHAQEALRELNITLEAKVTERTSALNGIVIALRESERNFRTVADFTYD
ncbi:MAG: response regulator [Chloroflexi bacterium]|nr:response regulator [Chloroflexota bacterium]